MCPYILTYLHNLFFFVCLFVCFMGWKKLIFLLNQNCLPQWHSTSIWLQIWFQISSPDRSSILSFLCYNAHNQPEGSFGVSISYPLHPISGMYVCLPLSSYVEDVPPLFIISRKTQEDMTWKERKNRWRFCQKTYTLLGTNIVEQSYRM